MGANMKFVLILLVSGAAGWAATDSLALAGAHAGLALAREGKYELSIPRYRPAIAPDPRRQADVALAKVKELAQEEPPALLIKTPGRPEK
jgi:hypothetical protein